MELSTRLMSRSEAARLLNPLLPSLTAIGIAADRAAHEVCRRMIPQRQRADVQPKILGVLRTTLWTEGVRVWADTVPGVKVHAPYTWTELVVRGRLHVRIESELGEPRSERRRERRAQLTDGSIPSELLRCDELTNVDLVPHVSAVTGAVDFCQLIAPLGRENLWEPVHVSLVPARKQLESWQRRDPHRVPWLEVCQNALEMSNTFRTIWAATAVESADVLPTRQSAPPRPRFGTRLDDAAAPGEVDGAN